MLEREKEMEMESGKDYRRKGSGERDGKSHHAQWEERGEESPPPHYAHIRAHRREGRGEWPKKIFCTVQEGEEEDDMDGEGMEEEEEREEDRERRGKSFPLPYKHTHAL